MEEVHYRIHIDKALHEKLRPILKRFGMTNSQLYNRFARELINQKCAQGPADRTDRKAFASTTVRLAGTVAERLNCLRLNVDYAYRSYVCAFVEANKSKRAVDVPLYPALSASLVNDRN